MAQIPYYLTHFLHVLTSIEAHYGDCLGSEEKEFLSRFGLLPLPAQCLYARLANRKGPYFHVSKLLYPECEPLEQAITLLVESGLLLGCEAATLENSNVLWDCFTLAELNQAFAAVAPKFARKTLLCAWLMQQEASVAMVLSQHRLVRLAPKSRWEFLKFLYFGELTENLSGFVVHELGHIISEQPANADLRPQFNSYDEACACFHMACLYQEFRHLRETLPAIDLYHWWLKQSVNREELPVKTWPSYDRLTARLGQRLEREKQYTEAIKLYTRANAASCRPRQARLLAKQDQKEAAIDLCRQMVRESLHGDEIYEARQLLNRLEKRERCSDARRLLKMADAVTLMPGDDSVENLVLRHYQEQGWSGVHSENWLWNNVLGLLLWDIIYDASYGSFHQPLQLAPADLYELHFYERRKQAIEARLTLLDRRGDMLSRLRRVCAEKHGIANPFVAWHEDMLFHIETLIEYIPASMLANVLRHMLQNVKRHCKGFPDLLLWRGEEYQLVEVKSPNDQLSTQQYQWLQFFMQQGIRVQALRVYYAPIAMNI